MQLRRFGVLLAALVALVGLQPLMADAAPKPRPPQVTTVTGWETTTVELAAPGVINVPLVVSGPRGRQVLVQSRPPEVAVWTTTGSYLVGARGQVRVTLNAEWGRSLWRVVVPAVNGWTEATTLPRTILVADSTPPGPIQGLVAMPSDGTTVVLAWEPVNAPDLDSLELRRTSGLAPAASPTDGDAVAVEASGEFAIQAVDHRAAPGSTVTYALFAIDVRGNASMATATITTGPRDMGGYEHTCAVGTTGTLSCWGRNVEGQLGTGDRDDRSLPTVVAGLDGPVVSVGPGQYHTCAVTTVGSLWCWGRNYEGQLGREGGDSETPVRVPIEGDQIAVAAGWGHTCALSKDGVVSCWGNNDYGQLGDGTEASRTTPAPVAVIDAPVASLSSQGGAHTCVVTMTRAVYCWGYNGIGALGDGTTQQRLAPVAVESGGTAFVRVAAGLNHTCGVTSGAVLACWGHNQDGQLGLGDLISRSAPAGVELPDVVHVDAGEATTCATTREGFAYCWGRGYNGELGSGPTGRVPTPHQIPSPVVGAIGALAASASSCANTAQWLYCWGNNSYGQVGTGTLDLVAEPTEISIG